MTPNPFRSRPRAAGAALLLLAAVVALPSGPAQAAEGLQWPERTESLWPSFQARFSVTLGTAGGTSALRQASLLGDLYWGTHGAADPAARWRGGFRATSGLVVGDLGTSVTAGTWSASLLTAASDAAPAEVDAWPYIGLGYSGLAPRGGWGFSADFGVALRQPSAAVDLGRALVGLRGWEQTLRRFDPVPMLQLGVRYTF